VGIEDFKFVIGNFIGVVGKQNREAEASASCSSSNPGPSSCENPANAYISIIDFGRTIGPFRCWLCQAHVQTLSKSSTNRVEVALSRALAHVHLQQSRKVTPMIMGTVKFYNDMKGFGFIQPDNGDKDVFVHATALERAGMRNLVEGQKVSFDTAEDRRSGKIAVNNIQKA
jgi:CspA family cold shock protein